MSQHDYNIANAPGATFRSDLNSALQAIAEQNSGASEPSTTFANMLWFDSANNLLKMRDASNTSWITIASKSGTTWTPYYQGTALGNGCTADLASQAEAEAGTNNTKLMTPLRAAQRNAVEGHYVGSFTYDMTTTGSVAITGVGFKPKSVIVFMTETATERTSWGFADAAITQKGLYYYATGSNYGQINRIGVIYQSATIAAYLDVASFDTDGITFEKSKASTPSGTATVNYILLR